MSDNSLIAPVQSDRNAYDGAGLVEGYFDMVAAFKSDGWVDDALGVSGFALEVVGSVLDPFSALFANGIGWAMEYFEPLREMLEELTGKADVVMSHAQTWTNMSSELKSIAEDLNSFLATDMPGWSGDAANAYQALMIHNVNAANAMSATAEALAAATEGAGGLVQVTYELVRDLIAELVAHVIVWAIEAIFVVTLPVIAAQIVAAVVKWAGIILGYGMALVQSLQNLKALLGL
ncbi:WXG100 family type VII secretion target [Glycomyces sp. NPDC048151]|uniref:WXG100 family type VII secretion target n=1 Tax=Glycomyces sp. NPDC048151 TaxID=3364002 RepID=UPI003712AAA5